MMERLTDGERPFWLSRAIVSTSCSATILCRRLSLDCMTDYEDVEIMIVARPLRGEEGMGAAAVGKGHRNTTYTGYRGPEAPKGKGRRRERDRERAQFISGT